MSDIDKLSFQAAIDDLYSRKVIEDKTFFTGIENASKKFDVVFELMLKGKPYKRLPEYDGVVDWLTDNEGKGLFLYGNCGRGKSFIARRVIPAIMLHDKNIIMRSFSMKEAFENMEDIIKNRSIIILDDLGAETDVVSYGMKVNVFNEIIDDVEQKNKLLIVTSNLTSEQIMKRYGERTLERIKSTTKRVLFTGDSMR